MSSRDNNVAKNIIDRTKNLILEFIGEIKDDSNEIINQWKNTRNLLTNIMSYKKIKMNVERKSDTWWS